MLLVKQLQSVPEMPKEQGSQMRRDSPKRLEPMLQECSLERASPRVKL
jgi:hypothetical protein